MVKGHGVSFLLLILVLTLRPHMAGAAYPFAQGLLLIPALVGLAMLFLNAVQSPLPGKRLLWVLVVPWALMAWSLMSLTWTPDPGQGAREAVDLLCNLTIFTVVFIMIQERPDLQKLFVPVSALVVLPVLASAVYQRIFGLDRIRETLLIMDRSGEPVADLAGFISQHRVFAGFLNSNMLAGFLAISIPLTLDLALAASHRRRIIYFSILTALQAAVLLLTGSLGGTLVALAMAGSVLILRRGIGPRVIVPGCVLIILLGAGLLSIRGVGFLLGPDSSLVQRAGYMAAGLRMTAVHPLIGWGAGASPGALMGFVASGIRPVTDPHNFLVRAWISWGIPGLVLLLVFLSLWAKNIIGLFRDTGTRMLPPGYAGFVFGSGAFLAHSLLDMDFFVPETALFGWCALGAALGLTACHFEEGERETRISMTRWRMVLGGMALLLVLPAFVISHGESLAYRGNKAMDSREYEKAAILYSNARAVLPFSGRFAIDEGRARSAAGDEELAVELFRKADSLMRASPYPSWEMGRAFQEEGHWSDSIAPLEKALSRYPTSPRIRIDLARSYFNLGDSGQVLRLLEEARSLAMFDPQSYELADGILSRVDR